MGVVHNNDPVQLQTVIQGIPPVLRPYRNPYGGDIPLYNASGQIVGYIRHTVHIPVPPGEIVIVIRNRGPHLIDYTDVLPAHTFYAYIACLTDLGTLGGYNTTPPCPQGQTPCFLPGNQVTRGQLAKIVSNAAEFSEPAGAQQFQDVPPGHTFYDYIWRLYARGYITGYPCGGPGEPCVPPGNLPYYRPNANVTRGQLSKIVSNAAGLNDTPQGQSFEDVPPGSTFYVWIERLGRRGIMSGYPCGGPGEPCVPPGNLPYYRLGANASRGQSAKIVANTFFPYCPEP